MREAQALLDEGKPFHAHEVLEDAWKTGPTDEADLWKGLAQLAVGLTHLGRQNPIGAVTLLRRGADHLTSFATDPRHGINVAGLQTWARDLADELANGSAIDDPARLAPRIRAD